METADPQKMLMHLGTSPSQEQDSDEGDEVERMIKRERGIVKNLSTSQEYNMLVNVSDPLEFDSLNIVSTAGDRLTRVCVFFLYKIIGC